MSEVYNTSLFYFWVPLSILTREHSVIAGKRLHLPNCWSSLHYDPCSTKFALWNRFILPWTLVRVSCNLLQQFAFELRQVPSPSSLPCLLWIIITKLCQYRTQKRGKKLQFASLNLTANHKCLDWEGNLLLS